MVDFSKVYPVQSIARSNCDPRILQGTQAGSTRLGVRGLALAAVVAVVFYGATLTQTTYKVVRKPKENFSLSQKHADNWYALYAFGSVYNLCT